MNVRTQDTSYRLEFGWSRGAENPPNTEKEELAGDASEMLAGGASLVTGVFDLAELGQITRVIPGVKVGHRAGKLWKQQLPPMLERQRTGKETTREANET